MLYRFALKMHYVFIYKPLKNVKSSFEIRVSIMPGKAYLTLFQLGRNTFYLMSRDKAKWE